MKFLKNHYLNIILAAVIAAMFFFSFRLFGDSPAAPDLVIFGLLCCLLISMQVFESGEHIRAQLRAIQGKIAICQPTQTTETQRDRLELALVSGSAIALGTNPYLSSEIAEGIKKTLDTLHPHAESMPASRRSTTSLPVIDPSPDAQERAIQAMASAGPRVTKEDIEAEIAQEHYFTAEQGASHAQAFNPRDHGDVAPVLGRLTFCVLVLRNGFTVTGESACVSAANFNAQIGRDIARDNAIEKMWLLMGFRLADKLAA